MERNMKILMVSAAILPFWKCGVATVVDDLRAVLERQGHEVELFALDLMGGNDRECLENETKCYLTAMQSMTQCAIVSDTQPGVAHVNARFRECLQSFAPDIVHFHTPQYFSLSLFRIAKEAGVQTVVTLHDWWWICPAQFFSPEPGCKCINIDKTACLRCMQKNGEDEARYEERMCALQDAEAHVDRFICVSSILGKDIIRYKPHLADRMAIIPNAVGLRCETTQKTEEPIRFVFAGGQFDLKGYSQIMKAFFSLSGLKNWELDIYGCTMQSLSASGMKAKIRKYISHPIQMARKIKVLMLQRFTKKNPRLPIRHHPVLSRAEIMDAFQKSHVALVCTQVQESFSLVTYEAMANGCCVIANPCGGPQEIVRDHENGLILKDCSGETLEQAIREMLTHPEMVERLRKRAYEDAESFLHQQDIGERYAQVYRALLERQA